MKCPKCGNALRISKKDERFALCDHCRKKFKIPESMLKKVVPDHSETEAPEKSDDMLPNDAPATTTTSAEETASVPEQDEDMNGATQVFSRREVRAALKKQNALRKAEAASKKAAKEAPASSDVDDGDFHFKYANIPPKEIREKQEREMRQAYDELLSIGKEERANKKRGLFGRRK